jgi:hypothetical protein
MGEYKIVLSLLKRKLTFGLAVLYDTMHFYGLGTNTALG